MNKVETERLLTVGQAAAELGVHPNTLRSWADKKRVASQKTTTNYRKFRPEDIQKLKDELDRRGELVTLRHSSPIAPDRSSSTSPLPAPDAPGRTPLLSAGVQMTIDDQLDRFGLGPEPRRFAELLLANIAPMIAMTTQAFFPRVEGPDQPVDNESGNTTGIVTRSPVPLPR